MTRAFQTARFIEAEFGGPTGLHAALTESGIRNVPALNSVYKYMKRDSMPGPILAEALRIREAATGESVRISDYFKGSKSCRIKQKPASCGTQPNVFD